MGSRRHTSSVELVDPGSGHKVRVTITSHWFGLQAEVTAGVLNTGRDMGLGLSDVELAGGSFHEEDAR
jgi:hypothetical protein